MKKIFIAININSESKNNLDYFISELKNTELKNVVSWISVENLHVTLSYLGIIKDQKIAEIEKTLANLKIESFDYFFNKVNYFPNKKTAKIIWVQGDDNNSKIFELKRLIDSKIVESKTINYHSDIENYTPHITLGRIKSFSYKKIPYYQIPELDFDINLDLEINSFSLMESTTKAGKIYYKKIKDFIL